MPFNGSGTFSIINTFIPNTTILSSAVNANFSDIATGLSDCLTRDGQAGMTAAFKAIAGSAGSPSITFTSDPTTGLFLAAAGVLGISSAGIQALTLDATQVAKFVQAMSAKVLTTIDTTDASTSSNINTLATAGTGAIAIGTSTNWNTNGYLLCGNEIMSYTLTSAAGITINTRGDMGTTSVSHATGSSITMLYSALGYRDLLLPARSTANRPTAPAPGDFAFNTGSNQTEVWNGTVWAQVVQPAVTPQGYLTPTSGVPIIPGDATGQGTIYYTPYVGNLVPVPSAGVFSVQIFTEASIVLSASQVTGGIYDIGAFISTAGSLTFGISPTWSAGTSGSVTPGACARGTGTGGTALTRTNGFYVNATTEAFLNGVTSYSVATASAVYLGSIYVNATAGSLNLQRSFGQNRNWGIFNAFNRANVCLIAGDATASWSYSTATIRQSDGDTGNKVTIFAGLAEEMGDVIFTQKVNVGTTSTGSNIGIGFDSTTVYTGKTGSANSSSSIITDQTAVAIKNPFLGVSNINCLEFGQGVNTFYGTQPFMQLSARWRA